MNKFLLPFLLGCVINLQSQSQWYGIAVSVDDFAITDDKTCYILKTDFLSPSRGTLSYIYKRPDGNNDWILIASIEPPNHTSYVANLYASTNNYLYYWETSFCALCLSTDGGSGWSNFGHPGCGLADISFTGKNVGYTIANQSDGHRLGRITESGYRSLIVTDTLLFIALDFRNDSSGYFIARCVDKYIVSATNSPGSHWETVLKTDYELNDICFTNVVNGYVIGQAGKIFGSSDSGKKWIELESGVSATLNSVCFINDSTGIVVGDSGIVLSTCNGGTTWSKETINTNNNLIKVKLLNDKTAYILAENGTLYSNKPSEIQRFFQGISTSSPYIEAEGQVFFYPNPCNEELILAFNMMDNYLIILNTPEGKEVLRERTGNCLNYALNTRNLVKGIYFVTLIGENRKITKLMIRN
jgi:hypothetical protein